MSRKLFTLKKENWINMKKILLLIVGIVLFCSCFCSCKQKTPQQIKEEKYERYSERYQENSRLFELTFKDEYGEERTHQFVSITASDYANGFVHWPDCKYCKERGLLCTH